MDLNLYLKKVLYLRQEKTKIRDYEGLKRIQLMHTEVKSQVRLVGA